MKTLQFKSVWFTQTAAGRYTEAAVRDREIKRRVKATPVQDCCPTFVQMKFRVEVRPIRVLPYPGQETTPRESGLLREEAPLAVNLAAVAVPCHPEQ
eukprot:1528746-Rhodomonas_salina.2